VYELVRCVVCGGAGFEVLSDTDGVRRESELLWEFHSRRLSPRTPPERLVDRVAFSQDPPWRVVRCASCGHVFRSPAEHRTALRAAYAQSPVSARAFASLHGAQRRFARGQVRRLTRVVGRRGTGLEVGSYVGGFLAAARDARWQFEGLDVNAELNELVRARGFTVHDGELEAHPAERTFDAVTIWNTFDQLPDPRAAVRAAGRLLRPGGVLAIRVPNGGCYARWRRDLDAGGPARRLAVRVLALNNLLTFPYRNGFTPAALRRLLGEEGFRVVQVVRDVLVPTADEWTRWWAALEERTLKPLTRRWTPWFEVYALPDATARP